MTILVSVPGTVEVPGPIDQIYLFHDRCTGLALSIILIAFEPQISCV